jgi:hypothetical protein
VGNFWPPGSGSGSSRPNAMRIHFMINNTVLKGRKLALKKWEATRKKGNISRYVSMTEKAKKLT